MNEHPLVTVAKKTFFLTGRNLRAGPRSEAGGCLSCAFMIFSFFKYYLQLLLNGNQMIV